MKKLISALLLILVGCETNTLPPTPSPPPTPAPSATAPVPPYPTASAIATLGVSETKVAPAVTTEVTSWIQEHAVPFDTSEPGGSYDDLQPLKKMIGNARIVALGEATHGTHEFFHMKHRMLEFLVKEMGFSVLAMETNWPGSNLANDYVQSGEGYAMSVLQWPWDTKEVSAMLEWMRTHNAAPGGAPKISFQGFDMQPPDRVIQNVLTYIRKVAPSETDSIEALYSCYRPYAEDISNLPNYANVPEATRLECRGNLQKVYDELESHRAAYEAALSPQEFAHALHNARILVQSEAVTSLFNDKIKSSTQRDEYLAENISWILEQAGPDAKIVIWAHNDHIGTVPDGQIVSMGQHLRERYGKEIVTFGFTFYDGSFNAFSLTGEDFGPLAVHQASPPPEDSYEFGFGSASVPRMFLDLRNIQPGFPATDWLLAARRHRTIGGAYDSSQPEVFYQEVSLGKKYDVIIYFRDTTPSISYR